MKKTILILVLGTLALAAQDVHFGVQGALALPTGDLSDVANWGIQVGGHAKFGFLEGHGVMGRADLTFFSQNNGVNVTDLALAADYTYHFDRRQTGPYVLAGLSLQGYQTSFSGFSRNNNGLGLDLGGGWDLDRHVGLQARYTTNSFSNYTYSSLNLGATYTF